MTILFGSDYHFYHSNVIRYSNRPFENADEMNEHLIKEWNRMVKPNDTIYHLGDFSFAKLEATTNIIRRLNGNIIFIFGNHDKVLRDNQQVLMREFSNIKGFHDHLELKHDGNFIVMNHYAFRVWNKSHYGTFNLHGHCVDDATEILTATGWKTRKQLQLGEAIVSYNMNSGQLESDTVNDIIDVQYTGEVYHTKSKSYDMRLSEKHEIVTSPSKTAPCKKMRISDFSKKAVGYLITSSENIDKVHGIGIKPELLKLYILMAADGNIKTETDLCRIGIKRPRKITYLRNLLQLLKLPFNEHNQKDGSISFNFYIPDVLKTWNMKGLDVKLLNANAKDAETIIEAYGFSDGHFFGNNGIIIYSAKESEIDLLQAMFCQTGYAAKKHSRHHGFGNNLQHQLSVTPRTRIIMHPKKRCTVERVTDEHFWCVSTNNSTWVMRRNGCVQITGNSHGALPPIGKQLDCGIDCKLITDEYRPVTYDEIKAYMSERKHVAVDHHE